jgi:hypothetical protein
MSTAELTKLTPVDGNLSAIGNPQQMMKRVQQVAELLKDVVVKQELSQKMGAQEHLLVEAWQFCGYLLGVSAKITAVRAVVDELTGAAGFEADADAILMSTGTVVSSGQAMCLNNEDNWSFRPKYEYVNGERKHTGDVRVPSFQIKSMAQTRAIAKALSNGLRFVVSLAGYSGTPAEDMTGDEHDQRQPSERKNGKEPERKSASDNNLITEPQRSRLFAIAKSSGCPMNTVAQIITKAGFDIAANITKAKYDSVVKAVQEWQNAPAA